MANLETMYPAQSGTPENSTMEAISEKDIRITVLHADRLPDAPNLMVLGADTPFAETVLMTFKHDSTITVERGYDNSIARPWPPGTLIGRFFCAMDQDAMQKNIRIVNDDLEDSKARTISITIPGNTWINKENTVQVDGLLESNCGVIGCPNGITDDQIVAVKLAEITVSGQSNGRIVLKASGVAPEIDIPAIITIVGEAADGMITASFPSGSNTAASICAEKAAESAAKAEIALQQAKQVAEKNGYFYFGIENGRLIETRTDNVSQDIKFTVENGRLIAVYE